MDEELDARIDVRKEREYVAAETVNLPISKELGEVLASKLPPGQTCCDVNSQVIDECGIPRCPVCGRTYAEGRLPRYEVTRDGMVIFHHVLHEIGIQVRGSLFTLVERRGGLEVCRDGKAVGFFPLNESSILSKLSGLQSQLDQLKVALLSGKE